MNGQSSEVLAIPFDFASLKVPIPNREDLGTAARRQWNEAMDLLSKSKVGTAHADGKFYKTLEDTFEFVPEGESAWGHTVEGKSKKVLITNSPPAEHGDPSKEKYKAYDYACLAHHPWTKGMLRIYESQPNQAVKESRFRVDHEKGILQAEYIETQPREQIQGFDQPIERLFYPHRICEFLKKTITFVHASFSGPDIVKTEILSSLLILQSEKKPNPIS